MAAMISTPNVPIWSESQLRDMAHQSGRSAQSRCWALDRLRHMLGAADVAPLAVDLLADAERHVADCALTMLGDAAGPHCAGPVEAFCQRDDLPAWARPFATVLLAMCGDPQAQRDAFDTEGAPAYFEQWATHDPAGFAHAAAEHWHAALDRDTDALIACTTAAQPPLARPLLHAIDQLDTADPAREDLLVRTVGRAGFGLTDLAADMPLEWHPREAHDFDSRVDTATIEARIDALSEHIQHGVWHHVAAHCLDTIAAVADMGAADLDVPPLRWAFALADALRDDPALIADDYERARLAFALQEAVLLDFDIEATLQARPELTDALALYGWSVGAQRDRLEEVIAQRWTGSQNHHTTIARWLDDLQDEFEWLDALELAARLPGYEVGPCLMALVDQVVDDGAGYDLDWAADALLAVLNEQPHIIAEHPDRLLLDHPVVADCALEALATQPWRWASDLILERFEPLVAHDEHEVLWETLADLADPRSLDHLVDQWRPGELRLAHAAAFVADVCGRLDELPAALRADLRELSARQARYDKRLTAMIDGDDRLAGALPDAQPIELALTCTQCRKTSCFAFDELYFDPDHQVDLRAPFDAIIPDRVVHCPNCGARDRYRATDRANHRVGTMLAALVAAPRWPEGAPLQIWHPELWDGTSFRRPWEAIVRLEIQAKEKPNRPEPWRRLGHLCTRFHADARAIDAYEHADRLDGRGVPDPEHLREVGIPTAALGPDEARQLLDEHRPDLRAPTSDDEGASGWPIHQCLVSRGWREVEGLASVVISRQMPDGRLATAAFLVDLGCRGVRTGHLRRPSQRPPLRRAHRPGRRAARRTRAVLARIGRAHPGRGRALRPGTGIFPTRRILRRPAHARRRRPRGCRRRHSRRRRRTAAVRRRPRRLQSHHRAALSAHRPGRVCFVVSD